MLLTARRRLEIINVMQEAADDRRRTWLPTSLRTVIALAPTAADAGAQHDVTKLS